jgi:hypothetical protein
MPDAAEATELLDVDVNQFAGMVAFVSTYGFRRIEVAHAGQARLTQYPADGGRRDAELVGNLFAAQPSGLHPVSWAPR